MCMRPIYAYTKKQNKKSFRAIHGKNAISHSKLDENE